MPHKCHIFPPVSFVTLLRLKSPVGAPLCCQAGSLTREELEAAASVRLGDIICRNVPVSSLRRDVFRLSAGEDVPCADRSPLDVSVFFGPSSPILRDGEGEGAKTADPGPWNLGPTVLEAG